MDKFENIKEIVLKRTKSLINYVKENWQVSAIAGLSIVLVVLVIAVVIPNTQRKIRIKQADSLVMSQVSDIKQVKTVDFDQLESTIRKNEKVLVAIVDPNDKNYDQFLGILNDKGKMAEFEGTLSFFPILYNEKKVSDFYHLKGGITLIYFENQQEVERITLDNQQEIELYLVDHLNSLLRPSSDELDKIAAAKKAEADKQAAQKAEDEEILDELQNSSTGTSTSTSETTAQ